MLSVGFESVVFRSNVTTPLQPVGTDVQRRLHCDSVAPKL
jgi:hypothetical protein